jgi:RES domain-containing protein
LKGQDALYLSPDAASARVAIGEYVKPGDRPRVLLTFMVQPCQVFDLRHPAAAEVYALAGQPWQKPIAQGVPPPSWAAADSLRAAGHVGLIDPSRRQPGLWHITLFRWNTAGAPTVRCVGVAPIVM